MSGENYQTFDANGLPSPTGALHGNANVWFYKKSGDEFYLLFQKRAALVHNGGTFDTTAGGHIDRGETPLNAAIRETREEIGIALNPSELYFLFGFNSGSSIFSIYLSDRTNKDDHFTLNPDEVEELKWVALSDYDDFVDKNAKPPLRDAGSQHLFTKQFFERLQSGNN